MSLEDRFWRGYGKIGVGSESLYAHRVSWELTNRAIPDGFRVLHHCDNPPCVRPDHLFLGTAADNTRDMWSKGRGRLTTNVVGILNPRALLTEDQVGQIKRAFDNGATSGELADRFGVTYHAIADIKRGKNWRHVA